MRRKPTFEDRFETLVAQATPAQLFYMLGVLNLQVRIEQRKAKEAIK